MKKKKVQSQICQALKFTMARLEMAEMTNRKTSDTIKWDDLVKEALKEKYGRHAVLVKTSYYESRKNAFVYVLFSDSRVVDAVEPIEISKVTVDVNEKVYTNLEGGEDETNVKIVRSVANSKAHNYTETTTKGIEWGAGVNVGLQFGLPQVGPAAASASVGANASFKKQNTKTVTEETTSTDTVSVESHHQETVQIPPGKKAVVKMTSYRVRYKMLYIMEYKVKKNHKMHIQYRSCGIIPRSGHLTASQLLETIPGHREDEEYVYCTQEGELRWIADRMVVNKELSDI